jgi:hypothetical protein
MIRAFIFLEMFLRLFFARLAKKIVHLITHTTHNMTKASLSAPASKKLKVHKKALATKKDTHSISNLKADNDKTVPNAVVPTTQCCIRCDTIKPIERFYKNSKMRVGRDSRCIECVVIYARGHRRTAVGFNVGLYNSFSKRAKNWHKVKDARIKPTISFGEWNTIPNVCWLTGIPLRLGSSDKFVMSCDRIVDDDKNYSVDNVRKSILEINTVAKWTVEKGRYAFIEDRIKETDQEIERRLLHITEIPQRGWVRGRSPKQTTAAYRSTFKGAMIHLRDSAKSHVKIKKAGRNIKIDITYEQLLAKFLEQKGLCAVSGIPLSIVGDWRMSVERIDVTGDYTISNVCFICAEFQAIDRNAISIDVACTGWTVEKFREVQTFMRANIDKTIV